jgi:dihydrodipicolinate synthase/N-acetylneuraminate lyase
MKAALNVRGLTGGYPRPPYLPLDSDEHERVVVFMTELGLVPSPA